MIIFFTDRPLVILSKAEVESDENQYFDQIIDLRLINTKTSDFSGHVLFLNATTSFAIEMVQILQQGASKQLLSVTLAVPDKKAVIDAIKKDFKIIKAAGGIVRKKSKSLLIFRKGKWDLPKGKLDKGEKSKSAAVREIEEETGVTAKLKRKICCTWHTYREGEDLVLKRTKWYLLDCISDKNATPQAEEDIEKVEWLTDKDVSSALINSYSSIRYVFDRFLESKSL